MDPVRAVCTRCGRTKLQIRHAWRGPSVAGEHRRRVKEARRISKKWWQLLPRLDRRHLHIHASLTDISVSFLAANRGYEAVGS